MHALVTTCLFLLALYPTGGVCEEPLQPETELLEWVRSPRISDRANADSGLRRHRIHRVKALLDVVRSASDENSTAEDPWRRWQSPKYVAILLLGELRAAEAAKTLARNITWRVRPWYGGTRTRVIAGQFPAAESLAKIGSPALEEVLAILHTTENPLERHLCVWTLIQIEGGARADGRNVAKFRVEKAIQNSRLLHVKANLEAALEYFDKPDLDFPPPEESKTTEGG